MATATRDDPRVKASIEIDRADAWHEYLEETRGLTGLRYAEVEPWAWARLQRRLGEIRGRQRQAA